MIIDTIQANILIVDDQEMNVKLLDKILRQSGFTNITCTSDSRQVEQLYLENDFDLVLLDIRMPHLDGFEIIEKLDSIEKDSYVPILVLTAQNDQQTKLNALKLGAKDFLTKPFDQTEVMLRINNLLEVRLLHKQQKSLNMALDLRVQERTQELNDTRLEVIRRLGRAAEFRDNETGFHIIRMSQYAQLITLSVGLGAEEAELILNASPMHDIGKIGIPDNILLKPGKLDSNEWEIMKTHSAIGAEILSGHDSELMIMAREIALYHHEKYDGSGYPAGLAGADIPIAARIVALSDVFDALTSERPYKKAWPVEEAVAEIKQSSGQHFDPELVHAFEKTLPDILDVRVQYLEESQDYHKNTYKHYIHN
ncbi:MAG TPA: response regulator [Gammaproteobacteria bacterium]|nr:response regulator [Gammaproteobacteria bacterium]